ncbi:HAD-IA family hydrolase [Thermosulfurimonas marina]|uniref:HAD-IA family hydrolase n=1 Tax=Thermosulfurimonas marina TaxID=2047767 RepID=A0A6H1WRF1_9BACT|nr:HAD-IA family hydrolase [Thermosulfurimonas marina]QJA05772.1 HAD-IA family hydrolase [Thermosulfurimonas marina]
MSTPLRAVLFDAEGTLLHIHPSVGEVYARVLSREGLFLPGEELDRRIRALWPVFRRAFFGKFSPEGCRQLWKEIFSQALAPWLDGHPVERLFQAVYEAFSRPESFRLASGTREALEGLKRQGLKVAILSNWDERLPRLLKALGLKDHFEAVFLACELGVGKPAPEAFHLACEALGVAPPEVLMIGNDPEDDYQGALSAGLRARLYRGEDLREILREEGLWCA